MIWANFLHFYQPPTQTPYWIDRVTKECYRPITEKLLKNPKIKLTLNVNGILCELWEKQGHLDVIKNITQLVKNGQVELTGSAKYHPLLPQIPESEAIRQIKLNEESLEKYFEIPKGYLKGFFPPEMAYSKEVAKLVSDLGYKWIIAEELSYVYDFGKVDPHKTYKVKDTNSNIFFRDRYASYKILSGQISTAELFRYEFGEFAQDDKYMFTGMDGETFGHHRPGLDDTLIEISAFDFLKTVTLSEVLEMYPQTEEVETLPSTWSLMSNELTRNIPFMRWDDPDNIIHQMQWELTNFAIKSVVNHEQDNDGWRNARHLLDIALHSDQYWWASAKPWWRIEMVEAGAKDLVNAIEAVPNLPQENKTYASELYLKILSTAFDLQRSGKIDDTTKQYDEDMKMLKEKEDFSRYSKEDLAEMISIQKREMDKLTANLEFERAVHPRERIRELTEYLDKIS